jgi:hypothetical protein
MLALENLRETGWARREVFMAKQARPAPAPRNLGLECVRIFNVTVCRAVAHLTRESAVIRAADDLARFVVTLDAHLASGVMHFCGCNLLDRVQAIVAPFPERLRHKLEARPDQRRDRESKKDRKPHHLVRELPESEVHAPPLADVALLTSQICNASVF